MGAGPWPCSEAGEGIAREVRRLECSEGTKPFYGETYELPNQEGQTTYITKTYS